MSVIIADNSILAMVRTLLKEMLAKIQSSCNHFLLPLCGTKVGAFGLPKRGFGLMFLSAVRFQAWHRFPGHAPRQ